MSKESRSSNTSQKNAFSLALQVIQYTAVYCLGVIFITLILFLCAISKLVLSLIQTGIWLTGGRQLDVLTGLDAMFFHVGQAAFTNVMCQQTVMYVFTIRGTPNIHKLRKRVQETLVDASSGSTGTKMYPRLTQVVERRFGYYVWEDDKDFSLDNRIQLHDRGYTDEASLMQLVQEIHIKSFPKGQSPWELVLLPKEFGSGNTEEYVLVWRSFHSLGDGVRVLNMCRGLFDKSPNSSPNVYYEDVHTNIPVDKMPVQFRHNPFIRYLASQNADITVKDGIAILLNVFKTIFMAPWHLTESALHPTEPQAASSMNLPLPFITGRKLISITDQLNIQLFKDVSTTYGCTINDVFVYCLTGAFRRCDAKFMTESPTPTRATICYPINLLPRKSSWGENGIADFIMNLPTVNNNDPVGRLKEIAGICHSYKMSTAPIGQLLLIYAIGNHLPLAVAKIIFVTTVSVTLAATNLRGPGNAISLLDDQVTDLFVLANNFNNAGVGFSFMSYNGKAKISTSVDKVVAPNDGIAKLLADAFVEELKLIHSLAKR